MSDERALVGEVALLHADLVQQVFDAFIRDRAGAARHAHDFVPLGKQEFGEIGPVLSRDPRNDGGRHVFS